MFKHYLIKLYIFVFLIISSVGLFNLMIDPFAQFNYFVQVGLNQQKPALINNPRAYHLKQIALKKPQALIIGSSRAQLGLDAQHPGFFFPAYNLGMPLATIDEMADYFTYANQVTKVKQAVIAIDFFGFNVFLKSQNPFREKCKAQAFNHNDKIASLFGISGLKASIDTILYNLRYVKNSSINQDDSTGANWIATTLKTKALFEKSERFYVERKVYLPYPYKDYALYHPKTGTSSCDFYRQILHTCTKEKIACHVVILPVHARQLALIDSLALWNKFEDWKKVIATITYEVAPTIPLYDFTGYSKIHTEAIPAWEAKKQKMQYFIDSAHITPKLGTEILDALLLNKKIDLALGAQITPQNIDSHLQKINLQKALYSKVTYVEAKR